MKCNQPSYPYAHIFNMTDDDVQHEFEFYVYRQMSQHTGCQFTVHLSTLQLSTYTRLPSQH